MKPNRVVLVAVLTMLALGITRAGAQQAERTKRSATPVVAADQQILAEIKEHNEIMANLEYLTDLIGARLTGTDKMAQANRWTMEMFARYGLQNAHLEAWTIARAWHRGTARGRIVSPASHPLTLASAGWSPSTAGAVRGPVTYVKASKTEELQPYKGRLRGAIVITGEPEKLPAPYEAPRSPLLNPPGTPPGLPAPAQPFGPAAQRFRQERDAFFKSEGVAAVLRDSSKPHGLLNMSGIGGREYNVGAVPTAYVTTEGYRLIWRLSQRGPLEV